MSGYNITAGAAMVVVTLAVGPAIGGNLNYGYFTKSGQSTAMPPANYAGQWWVHPSGCEYSRSGRPGETVWYVIINSIGRKKCPRQIVQVAIDGAYGAYPRGN